MKMAMDAAVRDVIIPASKACRADVVALDERMLRAGVPAPAGPSPLAPPRIVVSIDGEYDMLTALEKAVEEIAAEPGNSDIHDIKWPASCSTLMQPCDVSHCFPALTKAIREPVVGGSPDFAVWLPSVLQELDAASIRVYKEFLEALPQRLSAAFCAGNIQGGWEVSGIFPLKPLRILERCKMWRHLTTVQREAILAAIPALQDYARQHGEVPDSVMQDEIPKAVLDFGTMMVEHGGRPKSGDSIDKLVENRRRTLWLNHPGVAQARAAKAGPPSAPAPAAAVPSAEPAVATQPAPSTKPPKKRSAAASNDGLRKSKAMRVSAEPAAVPSHLAALHPLSSFGRPRAAPTALRE